MLKRFNVSIKWHRDLNEIPVNPSIIIANEFFDAFPIQQFTMVNGDWHECIVEISNFDKLTLGLRPYTSNISEYTTLINTVQEGEILETSKAASSYMLKICKFLERQYSACLVIDYGYSKFSTGESLQAVKNHEFVNILEEPGECDLTSHVNFSALLNQTRDFKINAHGPITQNEFLIKLGIIERAGKLGFKKNAKIQQKIHDDVNRLIGLDQMGSLFKVIALTSRDINVPGFNF